MVSPSILPASFLPALGPVTVGIFYSSKPDEPDCSSLHFLARSHVILPSSASLDPFLCAADLVRAHAGGLAVIFVPGRRFDFSGTRQGRGGGWYDRFLSRVPQEWIRVGVARPSDVSDTPLVRQPWDEPMDWLLIETNGAWTAHETHARQ